MKKLFKYILIIIIVVIAIPPKHTEFKDLIKEFNFKNVVSTYYSKNKLELNDAKIIKNGNSYLIETKLNAKQNINEQDIDGQSLCFDASLSDYNMLVKKIINKKIFEEDVGEIKTCYGYNKKLTKSVNIDNNIVNIQIAYNNGKITIGNPVILGSF